MIDEARYTATCTCGERLVNVDYPTMDLFRCTHGHGVLELRTHPPLYTIICARCAATLDEAPLEDIFGFSERHRHGWPIDGGNPVEHAGTDAALDALVVAEATRIVRKGVTA